ncbi:hypothetical protein [Streptomyces lavendofoliae]|uniref:Uncharacterized protein n=1 Tax=Streptomyces lavendofoliae TaxID=67314 RepID=A0A918I351_9ACTN|nr:hypothetical protein [Streptomyces lavendofoliae]GGU61812.1 hypothetical protein GCM10010274_58220 [Streptomyces lavendofoliae]
MGGDVLGLPVAAAGPTTLIALVVMLILTGRLVPRRTLDDMREERDTWRAAHSESEKARQAEREQVGELLEMARLGNQVLNSLPRPPVQRGEVTPDDRVDQATGPPR